MEKNYIYKKDLGEIMEELAEEALKHADKVHTRVTFFKGSMNVVVYRKESPYENLSEVSYDIIETLDDSSDAMDHIFGDALAALADLTVIKKEEATNN